jgi:hypothetical protein
VSHSSPCLTSLVNVLPCEGAWAHSSCPRTGRHRWSDAASGGCVTFTTEDWDSGSLAFTITTGSSVTSPPASSGCHTFIPACYCSVSLSAAGKLVAQAPPSSVSRLYRGCNDAPHGAHRACGRVGCWRGIMACLRHGLCDPFPSAPLRTPLDPFGVTRLSSNWLPDGPPVVAPVLDIVVTVATDN